MNSPGKIITLALREFALPSPRTGSIESFSGYGDAAAEGREIHVRVQRSRAKSDPSYAPEVPVAAEFERGHFLFRIEGRMDGLYRSDPPKIEEIKSSFNVRELAARLSGDPYGHPYGLQLLTYGYAYRRAHGVVPRLVLHLRSSRSRDAMEREIRLDISRYEAWLELRLEELATEAVRAEKRADRRRKIAADFLFPFQQPRSGQTDIVLTVERGMQERRPMLIQAPTGLGKTVGVLYPVLREALGRGQTVVYVTPKNSQHAVAEDAIARFREQGAKLKSLTMTAKGKICFQNEPLCDPAYCEYARDYYAKVQQNRIPDLLAKKRKLDARLFRDLGERFAVCPFELQLEAVQEADVVICDYNYVFAPRSALGRIAFLGVDQAGKPNLVIDEIHNLPGRSMEYYSPSLSTVTLEQMRPEFAGMHRRHRRQALELLDGCIGIIAASGPDGCKHPVKIIPPAERFLQQDGQLSAFLTRYLDADVDIGRGDPVLRLCFGWSAFADALAYAAHAEEEAFFTTFHPHPTGGTVKITCCDASPMLKDRYAGYEQTVGFSATLKPFEYYARLSGLDPAAVLTAEFPAPFPKENRKFLIIPQISTKYADRERSFAKIADAVQRIIALRHGNYFVFFPSFEFLERVFAVFVPPVGFEALKQEREMKATGVATVLDRLRQGCVPTIFFGVQGGVFSEGVDYPGEAAIGAFVVGPPLPNYDLEREQMRAYYEKRYQAGFEYAYTIPAMAKAVQAAGRVIRSETDRGLIVLMDGRFMQRAYSRSMPADWFDRSPAELVSERILKDVAEFWDRDLGDGAPQNIAR